MTRYLVGDMRLVGEIEANAKSDHPIAQMLRASIGTATVSLDDEEERAKKRQRVVDDLYEEGLTIMNRIRESEAVLAAAEARRGVAEAQRIVEENRRMAAENDEAERAKERDENMRAINPTKKLTCNLATVLNKFLSGILNSKTFMFNNYRHNRFYVKRQMKGDGGDILHMEQPALFKYFMEFLEANDYKEVKQKPKEGFFKKLVMGTFGGIIREGNLQGSMCYQIDFSKLREFFADGKNDYDAEIVF
jgi:hypothetical protein